MQSEAKAVEYLSHSVIAVLDRAAFGVDRTRWLALLNQASDLIATQTGFGMIRLVEQLRDSDQQSLRAQTSLCSQCDRCQNSVAVEWDIPGPNIATLSMAKQFGFQPVRELTRMRLGKMHSVPDTMLQYAIASQNVDKLPIDSAELPFQSRFQHL